MIKLTNIINELSINKPVSFWGMVKKVIHMDVYYAQALLHNHYNNFEDYTNEFGLEGNNRIEEYKYYYDYFSKIRPNEITSLISINIFDRNTVGIFENISYKFIEMWYEGEGDYILILHNNNKLFLNNE